MRAAPSSSAVCNTDEQSLDRNEPLRVGDIGHGRVGRGDACDCTAAHGYFRVSSVVHRAETVPRACIDVVRNASSFPTTLMTEQVRL